MARLKKYHIVLKPKQKTMYTGIAIYIIISSTIQYFKYQLYLIKISINHQPNSLHMNKSMISTKFANETTLAPKRTSSTSFYNYRTHPKNIPLI